MTQVDNFPLLDGSQEVLLIEDGILAARISAMAQANLRGTHFHCESSPAADRVCIGLGLINFGLAVLRMEDSIPEDEAQDIQTLVKDLVETSTHNKDDDIPF